MSRKLRSTVPMLRSKRIPQIPETEAVKDKDEENKRRQKENFDRHHGARELSDLSPGDSVWLPDRKTEAVVGEEVAPIILCRDNSGRSHSQKQKKCYPHGEKVPPNTMYIEC